jgi:hypothetical protein
MKVSKILTASRAEMLISSVRDAKVEMVSALLMVGLRSHMEHGASAEGVDLVSARSHKQREPPRHFGGYPRRLGLGRSGPLRSAGKAGRNQSRSMARRSLSTSRWVWGAVSRQAPREKQYVVEPMCHHTGVPVGFWPLRTLPAAMWCGPASSWSVPSRRR